MGDNENGREHAPGAERPRDADAYESVPAHDVTTHEAHDDLSDDLERQARETMRVIRDTVGELGTRVRQAIEYASNSWEETLPVATAPGTVPGADDAHARALARRWVAIDFLVDPELAEAMSVHAVRGASVWKISLRERGETRTLSESSESYKGVTPPPLGPILPLWEYSSPALPDIESGERRERLPQTTALGACLKCNGSGHRSCATCEGKGFVQCPVCHGRSRTPCRRCRGRGRIADPAAERRARSARSYLQVQAERFAADAGDKLADLAERLRQDYGVPLPPSAQWAPVAPASGETIPCPDCVNGTVACSCGNGNRVCEQCHGTGAQTCDACAGSGRVVRFKELVRRFDTHISQRVLPADDPAAAGWVPDDMLRRGSGEQVWEGPFETLAVDSPAPGGVPADVWSTALRFAQGSGRALSAPVSAPPPASDGERRVISRRLRLSRLPLTQVDYVFAGKPYSFVAVGRAGAERFWAQSFPPRWGRVSRFLKALARDLSSEQPPERQRITITPQGALSSLDEFRARREHTSEPPSAERPPTSGEPSDGERD